ncbi:MAG: hypothetical protein ABI378_11885 [Chitinophagaceae bacterium]
MKDRKNTVVLKGMTTLSECMEIAVGRGFNVQFVIQDSGILAIGGDKIFEPHEVQLRNYYRFEGASDPDDMSILYLIEMTNGMKGTLADAYGVYADARLTKFLEEVPEIYKCEAGG